MVIFDEEDMKWAMSVFNVGKVVHPNIDKKENENDSGDDSVEAEC